MCLREVVYLKGAESRTDSTKHYKPLRSTVLTESKVLTSLWPSCPTDKADQLDRLEDRIAVGGVEFGYLWSDEC